jgi:hypothetical protein
MAAMVQAKFSSAPVYFYSWDHVNQGAIKIVDFVNWAFNKRLQFVFTNATKIRSQRIESGLQPLQTVVKLFMIMILARVFSRLLFLLQ